MDNKITNPMNPLKEISKSLKSEFITQKNILSYQEYLKIFFDNPVLQSRNSAQYIRDMIKYFKYTQIDDPFLKSSKSFQIFERKDQQKKTPIIGQEDAHNHINQIIEQFVRQEKIDKIILLHGPNGSSKTSTIEALSESLEKYSHSDEGAIYTFNWIFPNEKKGYEGLSSSGKKGNIGFDRGVSHTHFEESSFAYINDDEILCKISSEYKESPIYLIPFVERKKIFESKINKNKSEFIELPLQMSIEYLSSKNRKILDCLMSAYFGDFEKVMQHVQVERFYFSSKYRVGISTVEPQLSIDAADRPINIEKSLQNLPNVLQNCRLYETTGELVDANRGFIEYSDILKRPLESFKYLISSTEKMSIHLNSGIANLDMLMFATTNEKHLEAFKKIPDWQSFKGRIELVKVGYLLSSKKEEKIYTTDVEILQKNKKIGPYALNLVSKWAVLTRLQKPTPENYEGELKDIITKLSVFDKLNLYNSENLSNTFSESEKTILKKNKLKIFQETQGSHSYEGKFGASPREIKMVLYYAAQNNKSDMISANSIFNEIEKMILDKSVYEYLQYEPKENGYHDINAFLKYLKIYYRDLFHYDFIKSMNLIDEEKYTDGFQTYLRNISAFVKNEKIYDSITKKETPPNEDVMYEIEKLFAVNESDKKSFREKLVSKIASWRLENPTKEINIKEIFKSDLNEIEKRIYELKKDEVSKIRKTMLQYSTPEYNKSSEDIRNICEKTYENLEMKFGYSRKTVQESIIFLNDLESSLQYSEKTNE